MSNRYSVATRQYGLTKWRYVVVDGPVTADSINPRQIVKEFQDRSAAETYAAQLNRRYS